MKTNSPFVAEIWRRFMALDPPHQLVLHVELVMEAAELMTTRFCELGIDLHDDRIRAGVILHDAGKILHPEELMGGGNLHECAGERLVRERVDMQLARHCLTHARWREMECSTEELVVALADVLWKGKRAPDLEEAIIDRVKPDAEGRWGRYIELDTLFESIAAGGHERLERSRV